MTRRPHVLLVVLDAVRRDALAPFSPTAQTPTIAALARRGVAVPQAHSTAPWTLPSHVAMFTGALACEFGLDQAPGGDPGDVAARLAPLRQRLLASRLAAAGYVTHGYSANLWISPHCGLDAGFDSFDCVLSERSERAVEPGPRHAGLRWAREGRRSRGDDGAQLIGERLGRAIAEADPDTPQFFFVNLVEAHSPYLPPRPFNDLDAPQRIRAALECRRLLSFEAICLAAAGGLSVAPQTLARLAHLHRQCAAYMDAWLAGVLAALSRRAMLQDTLVIVCSDHGECFGEDGLLAHGFSLIPPLIHVPLVAAGPGSERLSSATGAVSLRELPRVITAAAGLDPDEFGPAGAGIAVSHSAGICAADDPRMRSFAERWSLSEAQVARLAADRWSATDGRDSAWMIDGRLGWSGDASEAGDGPPAALLLAMEEAAGAAAPEAEVGPPGAPAQLSGEDDEAVAALERQMKMLGYM